MSEKLYLPEDEQGWVTKLQDWSVNHRLQIASGLGGMLLLIGGFSFFSGLFDQPKIEVVQDQVQAAQVNQVQKVVEVSGSVQKPGVYKISESDRVDDLLVMAGGLSAEADRAWVEKNLNRAAKLSDGQKIYIPKRGESTVYGLQSTVGKNAVVGSQSTVININSASAGELDKLEGIGSTRAQAIINNRPYGTIDDLVSKKVIPKSVFDKIKEQIIAQ